MAEKRNILVCTTCITILRTKHIAIPFFNLRTRPLVVSATDGQVHIELFDTETVFRKMYREAPEFPPNLAPLVWEEINGVVY